MLNYKPQHVKKNKPKISTHHKTYEEDHTSGSKARTSWWIRSSYLRVSYGVLSSKRADSRLKQKRWNIRNRRFKCQ